MNKFLCLALLALACQQVACSIEGDQFDDMSDPTSEAVLKPSDAEETAFLTGGMKLFEPYCKESRDFIAGDIESKMNEGSSKVYTLLFRRANELGMEALKAQQLAMDKLSGQVRNPDAEISDAELENEVERVIVDGQKKIKEINSQPKGFFQAVVTTISATKEAVAAHFMNELENIKAMIGPEMLASNMAEACQQIANYEEILRTQFNDFRANAAEAKPAAAKVPFEAVRCKTSKRISRLDGFCKFTASVREPVMELFDLVKKDDRKA